MICVLHQKKCPCPIKDCRYTFGMIRKSYMLRCAKGIIREWETTEKQDYSNYANLFDEIKTTNGYKYRITTVPYFPFGMNQIPIDMKTKTVVLMGATIHLRI